MDYLGIDISADEVEDALKAMKHCKVLDNYGVCFDRLKILSKACPQQVLELMSRLSKQQALVEMLVVRGKVKAKKPGAIPA